VVELNSLSNVSRWAEPSRHDLRIKPLSGREVKARSSKKVGAVREVVLV
jgi:hypothetical protein